MTSSRERGTNPRAKGRSLRQLGLSPRQQGLAKPKKARFKHVPRDGAIPRKMRFEVLKRDGFRCTYCGASGDGVELHVDHELAEANGGKTEMSNLRTACRDCNLGKGAWPLSDVES